MTATTTTTSGSASSVPATRTSSTRPSAGDHLCGARRAPPQHYRSIIVYSFENRTWQGVGPQFADMPYLHGLATQCTSFAQWTETDTTQNSLTQYVGQVTGARQAGTVKDCAPSATCNTTADNLFRQARRAHLAAINYVEGAATGCSANGNAAKHIPELYLWGADDRAHCGEQVRPYADLDLKVLPAFAWVTPTSCNDGHDCDNRVVDNWAERNIQPVLDSDAYKSGTVAVFVWYDEDHPVPNLWIAPTAAPGTHDLAGAGYAGTLAAWQSMLGLPCLANACHAPNMRAAANV